MAKKIQKTVFLLLGQDEYLLSHNETELLEGFDDVSKLTVADTDLGLIRNAIFSLSFFTDQRAVVLDLEKVDAKKGEGIVEIIEKVPKSTRVIFKARTLEGNRKWVKNLKKQAEVIPCTPPKPYDRRKIIEDALSKFKLGRDEREYLLNSLPQDLANCYQEIEKLSLYPNELDMKVLKLLIEPALEDQVFTLIDYLIASNWKASLITLKELIALGNDPFAILGAILWQLRTLYKVSGVQGSINDISRELGIKEFPVRKAKEALARLPIKKVEDWFLLALEADMSIKRGLFRPDIALEVMVSKMCLGIEPSLFVN